MAVGIPVTLSILLLCCVLSHFSVGTEIYVDPVAENCRSINCNTLVPPQGGNTTLDEALGNITSNTTLYLKPGCHCIQNFNLSFVQNRTNINLMGVSDKANVNITCAHGLGLAFFNVSELTFANITVDNCGLTGSNLSKFRHTVEESIDLFFHIHDDYYIALLCGSCPNFTMTYSSITNTNGLGFLGVNLIGDSVISHSDFSMNSPLHCFSISTNITETDYVGGGVMLLYLDYLSESYANEEYMYSLTVKNSQFLNNSYCGFSTNVGIYYDYSESIASVGYPLGAGGGLSVILAQLNYSVIASTDGCIFRNNTARYGGGAHVEIFAGVSDTHLTFSSCLFEKNGLELFNDVHLVTSGSAFAFFKDFVKPYNKSQKVIPIRLRSDTVQITNTTFRENKAFTAGAVMILSIYSPVTSSIRDTILFDDCIFEKNTALLGPAMSLEENKRSGAQPGIHVEIRDTTVTRNEVYLDDSTGIQSFSESSSVIDVVSVNMTLVNSTFTENLGTVLRTTETILHIEGKVEFSDNVGIYGGAMRLFASSLLILGNNSTTIFRNNSATLSGGAIYVNLINLPSFINYDCFLFFDTFDLYCLSSVECVNITTTGAKIQFINNTSPLGGTIYGSTLETCPWKVPILDRYPNTSMTFIEILYYHYSSVFDFHQPPNTTKVITTPTNRVTIDDSQSKPYDITPGEEFNLNVTAYDRLGRAIPVLLASKPSADGNGENITSVIGQTGYWFIPGTSQAPLTVYGAYDQNNINITVFAVDSFSQTEITVNLLNCTDGFLYHSSSCICDPKLEDTVVSCDSSSKTLSVPSDRWVGPGPRGELVVTSCIQADYCQLGSKVIKPPDFDSQCHEGFNRTGLLCGKCIDSYSTAFGTNQCMRCSDAYLFWILIFACAGVGIVLAISFFKITITGGYLNGMLFYSNIVSLYLPFFAAGSPVNQLFIFIAFLNLDLGIPSCFYNGMDSLSRAGLQFVFPIYLWVLMLCITLLARRSHRIARRFSHSGFSASKLFATLMLMSYSSLTETCIEILGFARVPTISGDVYYRWRVDPNQAYFSGAHIPLVLLSIVLLIFYIIPAPFLLIFPSCTLKIRFLQKMAPIYDAFWAPFKPQHRYWIGLRLLLRGIPFIIAYFIPHPMNVLLLGIFLLALLYVQGLLQPFTGIARNAFDTFFIINILALVISSLYFTIYTDQGAGYIKPHDDQYIVFCVIVICAYIAFTVILIWHFLLRFPNIKRKLMTFLDKLKHRSIFKKASVSISTASAKKYGATNNAMINQSSDDCENTNSERTEEGEGGQKKVVFSELREPLLEEGSLDLLHHPETV